MPKQFGSTLVLSAGDSRVPVWYAVAIFTNMDEGVFETTPHLNAQTVWDREEAFFSTRQKSENEPLLTMCWI